VALRRDGVRAVLTDIEGTTTPVAFVHDTLFPFAAARLDEACGRGRDDPRIASALERLREEHRAEAARAADLPPFGSGAPYARHLMQRDRKSTGLKALQGVIWEDGYRSGALRAPVFPDVAPALERWPRAGRRLRVFSSGSVLAQRLLFAHTDHGDLTVYFEGYHDTTTGPKREAPSYTAIAAAYRLPAGDVLFLSDVVEELDAARAAGMHTGLLVRPGNPSVGPGTHPVHRSFDELG
jgi:enolase-phosphatase E1